MKALRPISTSASITWPLASYVPVERRKPDPDRRKESRGTERRRKVGRALRSLLRL